MQKAGLVLKALDAKRMANRLAEKKPRYFPTPPEIVVDLLTTKRHDEIQRAWVTAQRWQAKVRPAPTDEQPIEIINGREAIARRFEHLHQSAREEIVCMERPPYVVSPMRTYENVQKQAMDRGVLLRNIVDASVLDMPGKPEALRKDTAGFGTDGSTHVNLGLNTDVTDLVVRPNGDLVVSLASNGIIPNPYNSDTLQSNAQFDATGAGPTATVSFEYPSMVTPQGRPVSMLVDSSDRVLLAGFRLWTFNFPIPDSDHTVTRLERDSIFANGFE